MGFSAGGRGPRPRRDILIAPPKPVSDDCDSMAHDSETNYIFFENREALVLAGGGARAAYQVGVLRAIADWLPADAPCPFEVLVGTSAGALNAAALAARAARMSEAVRELERVWSGFRVEQVMRVDAATMLRGSLHWMLSLLSGGWL